MAKYLLSDENEGLLTDLEEMKAYFSTEKLILGALAKEEPQYVLGFNSVLINLPTMSLYDDSFLMEKYPHGLVTENFVLIPVEQFKKLKKQSITHKEDSKYKPVNTNMKNLKAFFSEYMNAFTEVSLNIELTKKDKEKIIKDTSSVAISNDIIPQLEKTTNRELLKTIEGKGYSFESVIKNVVDITPDVKEALKNNEQYIEEIKTIKDKIQNIVITEVNENISVEKFEAIVEQTMSGAVSPVLPLKIVQKKIDSLFKPSNSVEKFIDDSSDNIFPFLEKLTDIQFKLSIDYIYKNIFGGLDNDDTKLNQKFGIKIVDELHLNVTQKNYVISVITGHDTVIKELSLSSDAMKRKKRVR